MRSRKPEEATSAGTPEPQVRAKGTSVNEAYVRLRADILDLTLAPGMLLDEREQVARLGLSRTPIHEAFVRLAAEGLIVMEPNRQAQIAPLDIRDLPLYVEATDIAHRTVVHLAAKRRSASDIAAMNAAAAEFEAAVSHGDPLLMTEANRHFHATVASACHNPYLVSHYNHLLTIGLRVLRSSHVYGRLDADALHRQAREHRDIIAAISSGNAAEAEQLAHRHTKEFVDRYVRSLQENLAADIAITPHRAENTFPVD